MSLEDKIVELTAALRENTAALQGQGNLDVAEPTKAAAPKTAPKKETEKAAPKVATKTATKPAAKAKEDDALTYDSVREKGLKFSAKHGRDALLEVLGQFGATKGTELTEEQYVEYFEALEAADAAADAEGDVA